MQYCEKCGKQLVKRICGKEGAVPYCAHCKEYRFPHFSVAVSAVILNPDKDKILLISQYGRKERVLVAGYLSKGENADSALIREIKEEVGLGVKNYRYNANEYFTPSQTLMVSFVCVAENELVCPNEEVDDYAWYPIEEALTAIKQGSLAEKFLVQAVEKFVKTGEI